MIARKYIFTNEAEVDTFVTNLGTEVVVDEVTNKEIVVPTHKNLIFKRGFNVVTDATHDEDGTELTPIVLGADYTVDVIWKEPVAEQWIPKEIKIEGQSSIAGVFYAKHTTVQERYIQIDEEVNDLSAGSISIILGLKGLTNEQVNSRKNLYENLHNFAKDTNITANNLALLKAKWKLYKVSSQTNITFAKYKTDVVIARWNAGKKALCSFNLMIEVIRSKWKLNVLNNTKFKEFSLKLDELNTDTKPSDVPVIFGQLMSI